jgi:hypothetical protein
LLNDLIHRWGKKVRRLRAGKKFQIPNFKLKIENFENSKFKDAI